VPPPLGGLPQVAAPPTVSPVVFRSQQPSDQQAQVTGRLQDAEKTVLVVVVDVAEVLVLHGTSHPPLKRQPFDGRI